MTVLEKLLSYPLLEEQMKHLWTLELCREFHMTDDAKYFQTKAGKHRLPLLEGKHIHQFEMARGEPRYWVEGRDIEEAFRSARVHRAEAALGPEALSDEAGAALSLDHEHYRLAYRKIARNTDERTLIATIVPPQTVTGESLTMHRPYRDVARDGLREEVVSPSLPELIYIVAVLNSFVADWMLRMKVTAHLNMFYVYQLPMPRLTAKDAAFAPIVERAAKLTCTTAAFDDLARAVGLRGHRDGVTDPEARLRLRAELDGLVAHLYGLTEEEFLHVLQSFPVVPEAQRVAAHNAYRDLARKGRS